MRIGTKSVLFGAHCFFIHPYLVALAWWKLYGFPFDPRLWVAFIVHDLGYWGKPNMDGPEGETHVLFGATLMYRLFGWEWHDLCLYHSRFYAKKNGEPFSRLCVADKLSIALEPWWLYLPRVILSGEVKEYMALSGYVNSDSKYSGEPKIQGKKYDAIKLRSGSRREWFKVMTDYLRAWVNEHKDMKPDTWTPN